MRWYKRDQKNEYGESPRKAPRWSKGGTKDVGYGASRGVKEKVRTVKIAKTCRKKKI